jgi:protein-L-isoaspartate O-methyltransferase
MTATTTPGPHGPMTPPGQATAHQMTERARFTWSQGDFARAGAEQVIVGELLCRAIDIHPGERVLDVAAGSGNAALAADRLAPDAQQSLATELARCFQHFNRAADGTLVAPADYLQVLATRAAG